MEELNALKEKRGEEKKIYFAAFIHWALLAWTCVFVGGPKNDRAPFIAKALVFGVCDWWETYKYYNILHLNVCPQTTL